MPENAKAGGRPENASARSGELRARAAAQPRRGIVSVRYLPKRYVVNSESMRVSWPAENVFMHASSV